MKHTITHASLFSGIGGAELAATWMGWQNKFHCEINSFGRTVLDYWFSNSESYEDITKTDFTKWRGKINVLTGGFPCQPFSLAGRRKGAEDDRYLWPHMLRAIREIQPDWVVGENVNGIITMVQPGEETEVANIDNIFEEGNIYRKVQRFTLDEICESLEREGYQVQPIVIPACAVGAPHRRDRVWIVARRVQPDAPDSQCDGHPAQRHGHQRAWAEELQEWEDKPLAWTAGHGICRPSPDTDCNRQRLGENQQESFTGGIGETDTRHGCEDGLAPDTDGERDSTPQESSGTQGLGSDRIPKQEERSEQAQRTDGLHQLPRTVPDSVCERLERMHDSRSEETERQRIRRDASRQGETDGIREDVGGGKSDSHTDSNGLQRQGACEEHGEQVRDRQKNEPEKFSDNDRERYGRMGIPADTAGIGFQEMQHEHGNTQESQEEKGRPEQVELCGTDCPQDWWRSFPTQSPIRRGDDGISFDVHRLAISFPKWCQETIKAYGNAWVPEVAYEIFRAIQIIENDEEQ